MKSPIIVINAYNRPRSIQRLLSSLKLADIPQGTNLVFSLEFDPHPEVLSQVNEFDWDYGKKEIIRQEKKLGLIGHFLFCGGLTKRFGAIVYLEDDLFVSKGFYRYAVQVLEQYGEEENLAGFSLNALWFNGYLHMPFHPIDDGNACFFLQVPWFQGQIYTSKQWGHFEGWYNHRTGISDDLQIHEMFRNYKLRDDWFPIKTQYLIETNKYYCFPRTAHCVNFGDAGVHFQETTNFFQTELSVGDVTYNLMPFDRSLAVYDSFYELLPEKLNQLTSHLKTYDFEMDLNGTKDLSKVKAEYVITSVKPNQYEISYGFEMRPQELNIMYAIEGNHFYLVKCDYLKKDRNSQKRLRNMFNYHYRFKLSKIQQLKLVFFNFFKSWYR